MKGKKKKKGTVPFGEFMDMEEGLSKEQKRRKKAEKRMKAMMKKMKGDKKKLGEYAAFMAPGASRKRTKLRKKRVAELVGNKKITPADQDGVLAYATALSRDTQKVSLYSKKKRTLEDHFLRGLEKGADSHIFQEFSVTSESGFVGLDLDGTDKSRGGEITLESEEIKDALETVGLADDPKDE